jgi:hypothetical protein
MSKRIDTSTIANTPDPEIERRRLRAEIAALPPCAEELRLTTRACDASEPPHLRAVLAARTRAAGK